MKYETVEKSRGKIPLGRCIHKCKGNIKVDLKEIELTDLNWIYLAQDRDHYRLF
jgi:hypothetical protein